jgi:ribosomal 50S subunit-recycling heat shock protein
MVNGKWKTAFFHLPFTIYHSPITSMRLDQYLRASRLVLRRTVAQELCDAGAVSVNGAPARSSRAVHPGDCIAIRRRERVLTVRVNAVPDTKQVSRADAPTLYEVLENTGEEGVGF